MCPVEPLPALANLASPDPSQRVWSRGLLSESILDGEGGGEVKLAFLSLADTQ